MCVCLNQQWWPSYIRKVEMIILERRENPTIRPPRKRSAAAEEVLVKKM